MRVRCPYCRCPIDVAQLDAVAMSIASVECPNCGIVSALVDTEDDPEATHTYQDEDQGNQGAIAHFALIRLLGRGSFGAVWLARDTKLGRQVALKIASAEGEKSKTLEHEAKAAAQLNHANIVTVHEADSVGDQFYIASEYVEGVNLRDLLSAGKLTVPRVVELVAAVARALQYAHDRGVVHRDVKPANIMVNADGQPLVTDFGLAKYLAQDATISTEGHLLGTALYMAPEQARGRSTVSDGRADLYSLGVILFEMLTGRVPFWGNVQAVVHQKTHEDPPSPRRLNPAVPKDLETVCLKCLQREPERRYQSAGELADELRRFSQGQPIKARPVSTLEKGWRWCRRHRAVAGLLAALFASLSIGLIGVSFFWLQSSANAELATRNAELATRKSYRAEMNLAAMYLADGDVAGVRRMLNRTAGERPDLRGFAWRFHNAAIAPFVWHVNQGDTVADVAISADGRFVAACTGRQQIHVWDTRNDELLRTLTIATPGRLRTIAISPHTGRLASCSSDGLIRIWNPLEHDRPVRQIKPGPQVYQLRFSPKKEWLLALGKLGAVRVFDLGDQDDEPLASIPTGTVAGGPVENADARFGPNGETVAVLTTDGRVRTWNIDPVSRIDDLNDAGRQQATALAVSEDEQTIVTGDFSGVIRVWSVPDLALVHTHLTELGSIADLEFLKDQPLVAATTLGGRLVIFDTKGGRETRRIGVHERSLGSLDRSADGKLLALGGGGGSVTLFQVSGALRPAVLWHGEPIAGRRFLAGPNARPGETRTSRHLQGLGFLPGSQRLFAAGNDGRIAIWTLATGQHAELAAADGPQVTCLATHGELAATAGVDEDVTIWNTSSDKPAHTLTVGRGAVAALDFSPSGDALVVANADGPMTLYGASDWTAPRFSATPHESRIHAAAFSPDGRTIAVAYDDGQVVLLESDSGKPRGAPLQVPSAATALAFCRPGETLAIGTASGELHLRDLAAGVTRHVINAHGGRIRALAAFPDGRTIVSGGWDRSPRLWDTASGDLVCALAGHGRQIFSIAVSPDGNTIASGGLEGDIRIWRSE